MKRAVLITGHFPRQRRKASMLWVADHLQRMGWHVTIVTIGYSWISHLKADARLKALDYAPTCGTTQHSATLTSLYGLPVLHPFQTRFPMLNALLKPSFASFTHFWQRRIQPILQTTDLVICESGAPALLAPFIARTAPDAVRIYRANDDIRLLNAPLALIAAEQDYQDSFTRISTASPLLAARFATHKNVTIDPMGVPYGEINVSQTDPYLHRAARIAVCAGTTQLDIPAILRTATARPDWHLHILGRLKSTPPDLPNITWHGEQTFETTLAHIAHADIGLAPYLDVPGVEYQTTNSNRILLYRHFGLPTLGPDRLCHPAIPSIIGYSAPDALARCESWVKTPEAIPDWSELAERLTQNGVTDPPSEISTLPDTIVKSRVKTVPAFASSA